MRFRPLVDGRPARPGGAHAQPASHVASARMPKPPMFAFPPTLVQLILDFLQNRGSTSENELGTNQGMEPLLLPSWFRF